MVKLETSLLREKFTIYDPNDISSDSDGPVLALSNRLVVELHSPKGDSETFVVRAQNMHSCVRMAARIVRAYYDGGPLLNRSQPYDWSKVWNSIVNDYEYAFNPQRWVCVYNKGQCIFEAGEHHAFLDVIEKCDIRSKGQYEQAIQMAEDAFKQAGRVVSITHDSNVALVLDMEDQQSRCGVILRGPNRTTTFNFSVFPKKEPKLSIPQVMSVGAAFLEGVQLAFMIGMNNEKIRLGIIERHSEEEKQTREAKQRISRLNAEIANMEAACEVRYRPERPEFPHIVMDAEKLAKKIIRPPPPKEHEEEEYVE